MFSVCSGWLRSVPFECILRSPLMTTLPPTLWRFDDGERMITRFVNTQINRWRMSAIDYISENSDAHFMVVISVSALTFVDQWRKSFFFRLMKFPRFNLFSRFLWLIAYPVLCQIVTFSCKHNESFARDYCERASEMLLHALLSLTPPHSSRCGCKKRARTNRSQFSSWDHNSLSHPHTSSTPLIVSSFPPQMISLTDLHGVSKTIINEKKSKNLTPS